MNVGAWIKVALGTAAIIALLFAFSGQRGGAERAKIEPPRLDDRWANDFESAVLRKTDRLIRQIDTTKTAVASPEPAIAATERILSDDAPGKMPPVVLVDREGRPAARKMASVESNICTRHNRRKVWVSKYKWRCLK